MIINFTKEHILSELLELLYSYNQLQLTLYCNLYLFMYDYDVVNFGLTCFGLINLLIVVTVACNILYAPVPKGTCTSTYKL